VTALALRFFIQRHDFARFAKAAAAIVFLLIPLVPVGAMFFVAPDLEGARYLYLPSVGWSILVVAIASDSRSVAVSSIGAIAVLLALSVFGTRIHLGMWNAAAQLRDRIEAEVSAQAASCPTLAVSNVPEALRGAFVFRNGIREALEQDLGVAAPADPRDVAAGCSFVWRDGLVRER
jgi:hypothetical protein